MVLPRVLLSLAPPVWPNLPPLGIAFLQSYLTQFHIHADLFDLNNYFYNVSDSAYENIWLKSCNIDFEENMFFLLNSTYTRQLENALNKILQYDTIGFSCFKSNLTTTLALINLIKQKKPDTRIVLGGPEMARLYFKEQRRIPDFLRNLADFIVVGEGEGSFYQYLKGYNKSNLALFEQLPDLAQLKFPTYQGFNFSSYPKRHTLPIQFSRGCIRKCSFCSERLLHKGIRMRPIQNIIEEIEFHRNSNNIKNFIFFDSLINADLKKLEQLCDAMISRFGAINWEAQIAVRSDMPQHLLTKMKQSGCYNLFVGLESGTDSVLKRMNKGFSTQQAEDFFQALHTAGLAFGISLITGYPGESEEEFQQTLDFIISNKKLIPKIEQLNPFTYYEGTKAEKSADYSLNPQALTRMRILTGAFKDHGIKYTNAYIGNLIEK